MLGIDAQFAVQKLIGLVCLVFIFSILLAFILSVLILIRDNSKYFWVCFTQTCAIALVFGTLAIVTGFLTTTSRQSAISDVIPAVLTLIGGLALYIIDKGYEKFYVTGIAVFSFSTMLFVGGAMGSLERQKGEAQSKSPALLKREADVEFAINAYRKSLGLSPLTLNPSSIATK